MHVKQSQSISAWIVVVCLLLLNPLISHVSKAESNEHLEEVLIVTGEFPPFSSESMPGQGMAVEIVRAVFAEMKRPLKIEFYPWARAELMVELGEAWGAIPYVPSSARKEKFHISESLFLGNTVLLSYGDKMNALDYQGLTDLKSYRVGAALGYWYIDVFQDAGLDLEITADDITNLKKLRSARVDVIPVNEYVASWNIKDMFPGDFDKFRRLGDPLRSNENVVIVSRAMTESEKLLQEFNAAFARIKDKGIYQAITMKYQLQDDGLEY